MLIRAKFYGFSPFGALIAVPGDIERCTRAREQVFRALALARSALDL